MIRPLTLIATLSMCTLLSGMAVGAVIFDTGAPDGRAGLASRPAGPGTMEIETADDFAFNNASVITGATFTGLIPTGASVNFVGVELYRVFPADSDTVRTIMVPIRVNSPSDNAFASRDTGAGTLTFTTTLLGTFTAANSIVNGINKSLTPFTGGEGPVTGQEVTFTINFATPFNLPAGHYFFKPEAGLSTGTFLWLSTARGGPLPVFPAGVADLQAWIRNTNLDPDWLRAGTDIIGGTTFNAAFSLQGTVTPEPSTLALVLGGAALLAWKRRRLPL
jgi:PEP-CTERM motif